MEDRLFQALAVLRLVLLLDAVALWVYRSGDAVRPGLGWAATAVLVGWSVVVTLAYAAPARRGPVVLGLDLLVAVVLVLVSPLVRGPDLVSTLPGFWVMTPLLAWAVRLGPLGGLAAGVVLAGADLSVRAAPDQATYGNVFLLLVGGPVVGYLCASLRRMSLERDRAERAAAAAAERTRLARAVHDGVLQALALVQRRGPDLGPAGADLARLAGEQEGALRRLLREQDAVSLTAPGSVDLATALADLERRPGVTVVTPGAVAVPGPVAGELVAAVAACLDNVSVHVGDGAPAWVLLEAWPDRVVVSVRDEGPGIATGRLAEAAAQGRLGVTASVQGRLRDLGGRAEVTSGPGGTEWELTAPLPAPAARPADRPARPDLPDRSGRPA